MARMNMCAWFKKALFLGPYMRQRKHHPANVSLMLTRATPDHRRTFPRTCGTGASSSSNSSSRAQTEAKNLGAEGKPPPAAEVALSDPPQTMGVAAGALEGVAATSGTAMNAAAEVASVIAEAAAAATLAPVSEATAAVAAAAGAAVVVATGASR